MTKKKQYFLSIMNAVHQSTLLIELTINEREGGTLLCNAAPYIPKGNIASINDEMKRISFLNEPIADFYLDEDGDCSVMAVSQFHIKSLDECIFKVISSLDMFKDAFFMGWGPIYEAMMNDGNVNIICISDLCCANRLSIYY